jgi:hypothetical protein
MPQKRISICTSRSVGSRRGIVVEVSGDVSLAAEYAFVLYVVGCMVELVARDRISQVNVTPRVTHFAPFSRLLTTFFRKDAYLNAGFDIIRVSRHGELHD